MTPQDIQSKMDKLAAMKAQAEKAAADAQVEAEQQIKRDEVARALRADRAAKLADLWEKKIDKAARQLVERYQFMMKSYEALIALAEEARSLLPADHCTPGSLITELTAPNLLRLAELEMFRQAGAKVVQDPTGGRGQIRRLRGPGAHTTAATPAQQNDPDSIPPFTEAIRDIGARAVNPAKKSSPRLQDAGEAPAATTVAKKTELGVPAAPQGVSLGDVMVSQQQAADSFGVDLRGGRS